MSTFTKRGDTYPSSRAVGWRGERRKRGEKGNGSGEIVGCRHGRLECLFFFSSSLGSKRRVLETKRRLASRPRARATCGVGVSDPERERGRAERERACLRSLPLSSLVSLSLSTREGASEETERFHCRLFPPSPKKKKKKERLDALLVGARPGGPGRPGPLRLGQVRRDGPLCQLELPPRGCPSRQARRGAAAGQGENDVLVFDGGLPSLISLFSCLSLASPLLLFDAFLHISAPARPASSERRVSRQRLWRESGRWKPRRRPSGRCPWDRRRDASVFFFLSFLPLPPTLLTRSHSLQNPPACSTGQPPLGV